MNSEQTEAEQADPRRRIIDLAFDAFLENGYHGTGISRILKASGLSKGGLYHHFASKQELFEAVADAHLPLPFEEADRDELAELDAGELKGTLVELYGEHEDRIIERDGTVLRHYALFFDALSQLPAYRERVDEAYGRLTELLAEAIRREKGGARANARQSARLFLSALEGEGMLRAIAPELE